jgi:hypothetical protein
MGDLHQRQRDDGENDDHVSRERDDLRRERALSQGPLGCIGDQVKHNASADR